MFPVVSVWPREGHHVTMHGPVQTCYWEPPDTGYPIQGSSTRPYPSPHSYMFKLVYLDLTIQGPRPPKSVLWLKGLLLKKNELCTLFFGIKFVVSSMASKITLGGTCYHIDRINIHTYTVFLFWQKVKWPSFQHNGPSHQRNIKDDRIWLWHVEIHYQ